jgi:hypothetical protein
VNVEIVGPFKAHIVLVDGRRVPYLAASPNVDGSVALLLDDRFALDVSAADRDKVVEFVAHCIAVAGGYTAHPPADWDGPMVRHPFG